MFAFFFGAALASGALHGGSLAFYEDDWVVVARPYNAPWSWVLNQCVIFWSEWPGGRPLGWTLLFTLSKLGATFGGVEGVYLLVALSTATNGYLVFVLLRPVLHTRVAMLAGLAIILGPADTTRLLANHAFHLQPALTFGLLGCLLYQRGRPRSGFLVASLALLSYELGFMLFLAAEPLRAIGNRFSVRRFIGSLLASGTLLVLLFALRVLLGEGRAANLAEAPLALISRALHGFVAGPLTSLSLFLERPLFTAISGGGLLLIAGGVTATILAVRLVRDSRPPPEHWQRIVLLSVAGITPLLASYAIQFNNDVTARAGRITSVHLVSSFTFACLIAAGLLFRGYGPRLARVSVPLFACVLLGLSFTFSQVVRRDFQLAGEFQGRFWREILRLATDAKDGDVILVTGDQLPEAHYILANSWAVSEVWRTLVQREREDAVWHGVSTGRPAAVFIVPSTWPDQCVQYEDLPALPYAGYTPPGFPVGRIPLPAGRVIVLNSSWTGTFSRLENTVDSAVGPLSLKVAVSAANLQLTPLGRDLARRAHWHD